MDSKTLLNRTAPFPLYGLMATLLWVTNVAAYESGSTGVDGAFSPTENMELNLPPSGIFNFTSIDIPEGVTVTFGNNATNTPVVLLAQGNVAIAGTLDLNGGNGSASVSGGPGGFDGGRGGPFYAAGSNFSGSSGLGPGGGKPGVAIFSSSDRTGCGGGGGGFAGSGARANTGATACRSGGAGGSAYSSPELLPLLGGAGGGGGAGAVHAGSGGGGGGGALLIAATGTLQVSGTIRANGGKSGDSNSGGIGGGGSGGAIRIVATVIDGNGSIVAAGGGIGRYTRSAASRGGKGSVGRIRLEAEELRRTAATNPTYSYSAPNPVFIPELPGLLITDVGGENAPTTATGFRDIVLPQGTANPVIVGLASTNIPLDNIITLSAVSAAGGPPVKVQSTVITGSEADGIATASINLPNGHSVLTATVSFTVTASLGNSLSRFAQGEPVKRVRITSAFQAGSRTTLITALGHEYTWPSGLVGSK